MRENKKPSEAGFKNYCLDPNDSTAGRVFALHVANMNLISGTVMVSQYYNARVILGHYWAGPKKQTNKHKRKTKISFNR